MMKDFTLIECPVPCDGPCEHRFTMVDLIRVAQEVRPDNPQSIVEAYLAGRNGFLPASVARRTR